MYSPAPGWILARVSLSNTCRRILKARLSIWAVATGVIGLTLLEKNPQANVVFVDESPMAVASSRLNVETNMPGRWIAASL